MTQSVHASIKKEGSFIMLETLVENQIIFLCDGSRSGDWSFKQADCPFYVEKNGESGQQNE